MVREELNSMLTNMTITQCLRKIFEGAKRKKNVNARECVCVVAEVIRKQFKT